jgi:hypothetical protein
MKKLVLALWIMAVLLLGGCEQPGGPKGGEQTGKTEGGEQTGEEESGEESSGEEEDEEGEEPSEEEEEDGEEPSEEEEEEPNLPQAIIAPATPELLAGDSFIAVSWKKVNGAENYALYYGESPDAEAASEWAEFTETAGRFDARITGLTNGGLYYVWVTVRNAEGDSASSETSAARPVTVSDRFSYPLLFFDYGHKRTSAENVLTVGTYTVSQGRTLVLAPICWNIGDNAVFEWSVDSRARGRPAVHGARGEYFSFTASGRKEYTVSVRAVSPEGALIAQAVTRVNCEAPEETHRRAKTAGSVANANKCFGFMPAPGQFVNLLPPVGFGDTATTESITAAAQRYTQGQSITWKFSLGSFGGYLITGFDHSVVNVPGSYSFGIKGNAFSGWSEPGVVWVSRDENGNGLADDTWYELRGGKTGQAGTIQRYAVTWFKPQSKNSGSWKDNLGNTGTYPKGYPALQGMDYVTLTGTLISRPGDDGWGYVDIMGPEYFRISDAVQADGTAADLGYIDFVKVQCGPLEIAGVFGEISTEMGIPFDLSFPNPALLIKGADAGNGQYSYCFRNTSGYDLTVMIDGQTIELRRNGAERTVTLDKAEVYFDYYGGNVGYSRKTGLVTFS